MSVVNVSLPKQWPDWTAWLLGIWLCLSPWVLLFEFDAPALRNAVVVGALIILVELIELSLFRGWEEWINVALGAWLIASAWLFGIANLVVKGNFFVVGLLVVLLALYEIRHPRQSLEDQT